MPSSSDLEGLIARRHIFPWGGAPRKWPPDHSVATLTYRLFSGSGWRHGRRLLFSLNYVSTPIVHGRDPRGPLETPSRLLRVQANAPLNPVPWRYLRFSFRGLFTMLEGEMAQCRACVLPAVIGASNFLPEFWNQLADFHFSSYNADLLTQVLLVHTPPTIWSMFFY